MKPQTIDDFCQKEAGSFQKFTAGKKAALKLLDQRRRARVRREKLSTEILIDPVLAA